MRTAFVEGLEEIAGIHDDLFLLTGDLGFRVFDGFREKFPDRFMDIGIAEANMAGIAAGLALCEKKVYCYSIIPFLIMRAYEQIRVDIALHNLNVRLIGFGAGFTYGLEGFTHFGLEDVALMRLLPNMAIVAPADAYEAKLLAQASYDHQGPLYIRLGQVLSSIRREKHSEFKIGKAIILNEGSDIALIATGAMVSIAQTLADLLVTQGFSVTLADMHTLHPLDLETIRKILKQHAAVFAIEEHYAFGGLGSALAGMAAQQQYAGIFQNFAIPDKLEKVIGTSEKLREHYGLTVDNILRSILRAMHSKQRKNLEHVSSYVEESINRHPHEILARQKPKLPRTIYEKFYRTMLTIRSCEESLINPILSGEVRCPCHLYSGEEAVAVGICAALEEKDCIFGNHRSHGHFLAKGGNLFELIAEMYGGRNGCSRGRGGSMHLIDPSVGMLGSVPIVAGTISLAMGAAMASRIRQDQRVAVSFFGDGATGEGVLYECLNFAALKKLPLLFVCENNLYATHMPIRECRKNLEIYKIAEPFGIEAGLVDGMDVTAVYEAAQTAIRKCREGAGPVFLECRTYRFRGHVGPDDNVQGAHTDIRPKEEVEQWMVKDPIVRLEQFVLENQIMNQHELTEIRKSVEEEVIHTHQLAKADLLPGSEELERYVYQANFNL